MAFPAMRELSMRGKRVLIRQDLNAPVAQGEITSTLRLDAALGTVRDAMQAGARVMVMSHAGRPREGEFDAALSLAPMAEYFSRKLRCEVPLCADYLQRAPQVGEGEVTLLENVRFNRGEKEDDAQLAKSYASLCDIFVMDAFGTAHRKQASTHGVALHAPVACAGPLLLAEIRALGEVVHEPRRPLLAVVGGAKVSTKLSALEALTKRADRLIPGGGIANTLLKAAGHNIGKSLHEPELLDAARKLLHNAGARGALVELPEDVVTAKAVEAGAPAEMKTLARIDDDDFIADIGAATIARYERIIARAGTVLWNGPLGVFEHAQFAAGTEAVSHAIAESAAFSVAGGGDTLAAAEKFGISEKISCLSTGGGAFLEFLEGKTLPALAALRARK